MDKVREYVGKTYHNIRTMKIEVTQQDEEQYLQETIRRNSYSFRVLVSLMFVCEIYNSMRVLFLSKSGLGTLNNRIYFTMYMILIFSGIVYLILEYCMRNNMRKLEKLYVVIAFSWLLWHVCVNSYDLWKDATNGTAIYIMATFTGAIFLQCKPIYAFLLNIVNYGIFIIITYHALDNGVRLNLIVAMVMAIAISGRRYVYSMHVIKKNIELNHTNEEMKRKQSELEMSLKIHEVIMEYTNDIIFEWDAKTDIVQFSSNAQNKFMFPIVVDGIGEWMKKMAGIHPEDVDNVTAEFERLISLGRAGDINMRLQERTGKYVWYQMRVFMQCGEAGQVMHAVGLMTDIDKQQRQIEKLSIQSSRDALTGLLNTKAFQNNYNHSTGELEPGKMIAMYMIDLDNFKEINDVHGHVYGDHVLKAVAETLQNVFREKDFIGRLGGDEFAAMMINVRNTEIIKAKAEQILKGVSKIKIMGKDFPVSCSVGVAIVKDDEMKYETLYNQADIALYEVKGHEKGHYHIFSV